MGTTNTAMLEGRITFRTTTDFIAIRNVFKHDDEYKHIRGWLLLINVCVCHNTQTEPKATYMLSLSPRCKYYDHTTLGKTRMKCIEISRYIDNILFLYYLQ